MKDFYGKFFWKIEKKKFRKKFEKKKFEKIAKNLKNKKNREIFFFSISRNFFRRNLSYDE